MEIKQGDKVRVSKDAPKMYVPVSFWTEGNSIVEEIHEGNAAICYASNYVDFRIVVPIKYLLVNVNGVWKKPKTKQKRTRKVDAEAKEAKIKLGDRVRSKGYGIEAVVLGFDGDYIAVRRDDGIKQEWKRYMTELVEPTEQTEAEKTNTDSLVAEINKVIEGYCKAFADIADSFDWQHYAADLAKEIVLKTVNSASDRRPMAIAEYATDIAKAVAEGLKRK